MSRGFCQQIYCSGQLTDSLRITATWLLTRGETMKVSRVKDYQTEEQF